MMQAGVYLRQDTETTLPELPEQHRIREKEEELHGLESVHMAESETKCTAPGLNTLEPECVTANSRASDLHHTSLIKTEADLSPTRAGLLKTESPDFTDLPFVTHAHSDLVKTETVDGDHFKTEEVSILPDIKCAYIKSYDVKLESSESLVSDPINTELNGAGVDETGETEQDNSAGEPNPNGKKSGKNQSNLIYDVEISQCDQCEKSFIQKSDLNAHYKKHAGEKPYKCDWCEKRFSFKYDLESHQRIHTGEKPYKCDFCGMFFAQKGNLNRHRKIHSGERPYKCHHCEKSFTQKQHLNDHERNHTGEKPYKCDQCGKSFLMKFLLKSHQSIHTDEKPFKCDQCEKCFRHKFGLRCHYRIHTGEKPYECDCCGMFFTQKCNLNEHRRIHSGDRPYKCDHCEKSFARKSYLKVHQRKHAGEKPYKCDQ